MDAQKEFYPQPIDKTAYAGCVWVAVLVAVFFITGVVSLWKAAGYVHKADLGSKVQFRGFNISLPEGSLPTGQTIDDQIKQAAEEAVKGQADKAEDAAKKAVQDQIDAQKEGAKDALESELNKQKEQLKKDGNQQLQNYLQGSP